MFESLDPWNNRFSRACFHVQKSFFFSPQFSVFHFPTLVYSWTCITVTQQSQLEWVSMNNYEECEWFSFKIAPALSSSFSHQTVKGHVYHVWFQWYKLLMTFVPALFKSNDCSGAWAGVFLARRSRSTDDIFKWQFGDSTAISRLIEPLMSVCFWFVAPRVREPEPDGKTGLLKYQ